MEQHTTTNSYVTENAWHGTVDASGRILIPAELRKELDVKVGSPLVWTRTDDGVLLQSYEETIRQIQQYFKSVSPPEDVWSEELIAERKREAMAEHAKSQRDADVSS